MYISTLYRNCKSTINKKEYHSFLFKNDTLFINYCYIFYKTSKRYNQVGASCKTTNKDNPRFVE